MKKLIGLLLMVSLNTYAIHVENDNTAGLSLGVKDHKSIVGIKLGILKLEVSDKSDKLSDNGSESVLIRSSEINLAFEPDVTIKHFGSGITLSILPLIGVSNVITSSVVRSYDGNISPKCTREFAHLNKSVGSECVSQTKESVLNPYNGASIKLRRAFRNQAIGFSLGAYSNSPTLEYKPQVSVGYTFGF
jgi:hypothetical protein